MAVAVPATVRGMWVNDERYADCVLISREGTRYKSLQGILAENSPVFKDMFEACSPSTSKTQVLALPDVSDSSSVSKTGKSEVKFEADISSDLLELHLDDSDTELRALTDQLHGVRFIMMDISVPRVAVDAEAAQVLKALTNVAFKYDMKGEKDFRDVHAVGPSPFARN